MIKYLEMKTVCMGPNYHHKCPDQRQGKRNLKEKATWQLKQNAMLPTLKIGEGAARKGRKGMQL